jgi:glyoxylase-like metal-dependent hydrolase (beta-lactamase superfamily II)
MPLFFDSRLWPQRCEARMVLRTGGEWSHGRVNRGFRVFRRTGWVLGVQLLLLAAACAEPASDEGVQPVIVEMTVRQVSEHAYYVEGAPGPASAANQGFVANAGFIETGAGVVVFDALGSPALARLLLEKIRAITDEPIVRVVMSHYHADHVYGLQVFAALDAEILAPDGSDEYLDSDAALLRLKERRVTLAPWINEGTHLVPPDQYLGEGTRFRLGDVEFIITYLGAAHSDGDLSLYINPDRVLFSGDVVFNGMVPFLRDADTRHWLKVLQRMDREKLTALVPGHGAQAEDPRQAVDLTRRYLEYLRLTMGEAVQGLVSFDEAYDGTDWSSFDQLPGFSEANRRNAYQVYLSLEAEMLGEKSSPAN